MLQNIIYICTLVILKNNETVFLIKNKTMIINKEYSSKIKEYARQNRLNGTKGEAIMWKYVLSNKKTGYQFNRQFVINKYIVDFVSRKLKLIIEIDGSSHLYNQNSNDNTRQIELENRGYTILRFEEYQVVKKLEDVITAVEYAIYSIENN